MRRIVLTLFIAFFLFLVLAFAFGPKPVYPQYDGTVQALEVPLNKLDAYISKKESQVKKIFPDGQSRIIWNDSIQKTPYCLVYLHGFSASPLEADPLHRNFAKKYGMNLYLHRLAQHGIKDREIFVDLTPADLINSAKEAIAIGKALGEKVIVMSTSTGSTLSTYLAAENPELIDGLIMYSPNFDIYDKNSRFALWPFGKQFVQQMVGKYRSPQFPDEAEPYWTTEYRTEGLVALKYLLHETMTDANFKKIDIPYLIGYYYKNEEEMDKIISIERLKEFSELSQTPDAEKRVIAFPDVGAHVICSPFMSKDLEGVVRETDLFAEEVLQLKPSLKQ